MGVAEQALNDIKEEVKKKADKACKMVAKEAGQEIQDKFMESVKEFYASYSPTSYVRTLSTYEASTGRTDRKHWKLGDMHYGFGIRLDPGLMGEPYNVGNHGWAKYGVATADFIFARTWDEGIHGFTREEFKNTNAFRAENGIELWSIDGTNRGANSLWEQRRRSGRPLPTKMKSKLYRSKSNKSTPPSYIMDVKVRGVIESLPAKIDKYFNL